MVNADYPSFEVRPKALYGVGVVAVLIYIFFKSVLNGFMEIVLLHIIVSFPAIGYDACASLYKFINYWLKSGFLGIGYDTGMNLTFGKQTEHGRLLFGRASLSAFLSLCLATHVGFINLCIFLKGGIIFQIFP